MVDSATVCPRACNAVHYANQLPPGTGFADTHYCAMDYNHPYHWEGGDKVRTHKCRCGCTWEARLRAPVQKLRRYGAWAGCEKGETEDPARCAAEVPLRGTYRYTQCSRARGYGDGGLLCRQHAKQQAEGRKIPIPELSEGTHG